MQDKPEYKPYSFGSFSNGFSARSNELRPEARADARAHSPAVSPSVSVDDLTRIFNTALLATRAPDSRENRNPDISELQQLLESPAIRAVLVAIRHLSRQEGISERQAAEQIIRSFRKVDQIWAEYVFQEGLDRLRTQIHSS